MSVEEGNFLHTTNIKHKREQSTSMIHTALTKRLGTTAMIVSLGFAQLVALPMNVLAAGTIAPTGPQGPTGAQGPTGPQQPTGPNGPTGVQPIVTTPTDSASDIDLGQSTPQTVDPASQADQSAGSLAPSSDSSMSNDATGSNSINNNAQNTTSDTTADLENNANVGNDVNLNANSGANTISQNTSGGDVSTGDLQGSINLLNVTNSIFAPGSSVGVQSLLGGTQDLYLLASDGRTLLPTNDTTGSNSTNANVVNGTNAIHFINGNTSDVDNDVTIIADTGNNTVSENSSLGDFMTGSIDMALNLVNLINLQMPNLLMNLDIWSIFGDVNGNLVLPSNTNTGFNSINTNTVNETNTSNFDVTQTADIDNSFDIGTNTGNNTLDRNTKVGNVTTGDVDVKGSVTNIANAGHPVLYLINVLGKWLGEAVIPGVGVVVNELGNSDTGANSENSNDVNHTNTLDATVDQTANVHNNVTMDLNTGNNTISRNTKVGDVSTGSINVMANVVNFVNSFGGNLSQFSLGIVNVFGNWFGNAKSPAAAQTASTMGSPTTSAPAVTGQTASASSSSQSTSTAGSAAQTQSSSSPTVATTQGVTATSNSGSSQSTGQAVTTTSGVQVASAQVLGAANVLTNDPQIAGASDHQPSKSLPWVMAGVALLLGWIFVEVMAARTLKAGAQK